MVVRAIAIKIKGTVGTGIFFFWLLTFSDFPDPLPPFNPVPGPLVVILNGIPLSVGMGITTEKVIILQHNIVTTLVISTPIGSLNPQEIMDAH